MRVKAPLLTLMAGGNPEIEYCLLKHLEAMIHQCPGVFDDEYRQLYVRHPGVEGEVGKLGLGHGLGFGICGRQVHLRTAP